MRRCCSPCDPSRRFTLGDVLRFLLALGIVLAAAFLAARADKKTEIARLIQKLGSDDFEEREAASKSLARIGEPALDALRQATKSPDVEVRRRATALVKEIDTKLAGQIACLAGHDGAVNTVLIFPNGKRLLTCGDDGTLRLWDVEAAKELRRYEGHHGNVYGLALSPDGKFALSGGDDKSLRLWDVESGKLLKELSGHTAMVLGIAFLPDGKRAVSVSGDSTVRIWDVEAGKQLHKLEGHAQAYFVRNVAVSPDGKRVITCSFDKTIRVWDLEKGKIRARDHEPH